MLEGRNLLIIILFSVLFYVVGAATIVYNLFPYPQLLSLKKQMSNTEPKKRYQEHYSDLQDIYLTKHADIVMLGDSLTSMVDWKELFNIEIINRGIPGDTTEGYLTRLDAIYKLQPKKVFLNGGTNDFIAGYTVMQVFNNYNKIIKLLQEHDIKIYMQSVIYTKINDVNPKIKEVNKLLEGYCLEQNITYINLNKNLSKNDVLIDKYARDEAHLSAEGYNIILLLYLQLIIM